MIGLMDSGSGGITALAACAAALPDRHFIYFGDHARAPYGVRPPEEVYRFTLDAVDRLFKAGCRLVLIACNTAAAIGLRRLQQDWLPRHYPDRRVLGVHIPLIEALTGTQWAHPIPRPADRPRSIAIFATPAAVASSAFEREIRARSAQVHVLAQPCPGLADAIEDGLTRDALTQMIAAFWADVSARPHPAPIDSAVLACTHYPLVADLFRETVPPSVQILTQPAIVAGALIGYLARNPHLSQRRPPAIELWTSGSPERIAKTPWLPDGFRAFRAVPPA